MQRDGSAVLERSNRLADSQALAPKFEEPWSAYGQVLKEDQPGRDEWPRGSRRRRIDRSDTTTQG